MFWIWYVLFCSVMLFCLSIGSFKQFNGIVAASFFASVLSLFDVRTYFQCMVFIFVLSGYVLLGLLENYNFKSAFSGGVIVSSVGDGVFIILSGGRIGYGVSESKRTYKEGGVVSITGKLADGSFTFL